MIFPTLEFASIQEQEELEQQQIAARGCVGPKDRRMARSPRARPPSRITDHMQPGIEYRMKDLMKVGKVEYAFIARLADAGEIQRTGTRRNYRYSKAAA